ncbi:four-helix bundle copper-binding protein [Altererythrobacter aerius]|uniref:Four-helix bundle copper-binding protein n=2 Tax=Tsuneonella aeria TaxID=1837929 RepID=A0A6I4THN1_9SPHN|nr:four-helix bundle copper-binding protein [Tsuneonella aeria]
MHHMHPMISAHPDVRGNTNDALIQCIEECYSCAQSCTSCADACLAEDMVDKLRQCIRLNLDCADICIAAGTLGARRTGSNEQVIVATLLACEAACRRCAEECERHASMHEHCRLCAEHCRRCEQACRQAIESIDVTMASGTEKLISA